MTMASFSSSDRITISPAPTAANKRMKTVEGNLARDVDSQNLKDLLTCNEIANKLCEHDLIPIFSNSCITTQDLLNYRQVNRSWRDAATAILLQRNSCQVVLKEIKISGPSNKIKNKNQDGDDEDHETDCFDPLIGFCNGNGKNKILIEELAEIISTSPKFPSSTFLIKLQESQITDEHLPPSFKTSLKSIKPHGEIFQTLRLDGMIYKMKFLCVLNIVSSFTPKLKYLDLELMSLRILPYEYLDDYKIRLDLKRSTFPKLPITKIRLSKQLDTVYRDYEANRKFMAELLQSAPGLQSIENVNKNNLSGVNWGQNIGLVRDLTIDCDLDYEQEVDILHFASVVSPIPYTFSTDCGVSHLTLDLSTLFDDIYDVFPITRTVLNKLLESVSHTLEHLRVIVNPIYIYTTIQIPPMKKLKFLELAQDWRYVGEDDEDQIDRAHGDESSAYLCGFREHNLTKEEYFPCLRHIKLGVGRQDIYGTLTKFFNIDLDERFRAFDRLEEYDDEDSARVMFGDSDEIDGSQDANKSVDGLAPHEAVDGDECADKGEALDDYCLRSVQVLEISDSVWPKQIYYTPMSKLFPNIRIFKIQYRSWHGLRNSVWAMCPNAESVEIYNVYHYDRSIDFVDRFFTGFHLELCRKLWGTELPSDSETINCFESNRVFSSICSLPLMLAQFGSQVSGIYAFQKMPQTKVTFSFPETLINRDDIETHLAPLLPYVHIIYEK